MSNYHSYFIAGPENISPSHMMDNENKEQALVRIVKTLALNGLNVFQLRAKNLSDNEIIKLLNDLKLSMKISLDFEIIPETSVDFEIIP